MSKSQCNVFFESWKMFSEYYKQVKIANFFSGRVKKIYLMLGLIKHYETIIKLVCRQNSGIN